MAAHNEGGRAGLHRITLRQWDRYARHIEREIKKMPDLHHTCPRLHTFRVVRFLAEDEEIFYLSWEAFDQNTYGHMFKPTDAYEFGFKAILLFEEWAGRAFHEELDIEFLLR